MPQRSRIRIATRLLLFLALGAPLIASTASAQPYYGRGYGPGPGRYAAPGSYAGYQHNGIYLRLCLGFGYLDASFDEDNRITHSFSGMGATMSGAIGGSIAPNLILFGELLGTSIINAEYRLNGRAQGFTGWDLSQYGFGPGMAYYIEPINLYVSGTLVFTKLSFTETDTNYSAGDTNLGIGGSFMVGKEWWIGRNWGFGVAGHLQLSSMGDPGYDTRMRTTVFSVLMSLSYN